jgi:hypothetical protein
MQKAPIKETLQIRELSRNVNCRPNHRNHIIIDRTQKISSWFWHGRVFGAVLRILALINDSV